MKRRLLCLRLQPVLLVTVMAVFFVACDDEDPKTISVVTTTDVTNVTATTAMGGGEITSNGNATITASGLCWSSVNTTPTIEDDTTKSLVSTGSFTGLMKDLMPSTTYHVRAYAINSVGTGYGETVTFTTGNAAPVASNASIAGTVQVGESITASYTYNDSESNGESGSTFQWYRADDGTGLGETTITGATALTYKLKAEDEFKYIRIGITPKAAEGTTVGTTVKSAFVGPVAEEPTTVTFAYNGATVTYGIITSTVTGRKWLDRNLGAPNAPSSYDDWINKGDLFQWGRKPDGHQLVNRAETTSGTTSENGNETTLSSLDEPGHNKFIITTYPQIDWRSPANDNLWQGSSGINNPCPTGWHIPTKTEWEAEDLTQEFSIIYERLRLTATGERIFSDGGFSGTVGSAIYWSSTVSGIYSYYIYFGDIPDSSPEIFDSFRSSGYACKCIKDE